MAMTILVIVIGSTLAIFRVTTNSWKKGEMRAQRYQTARFILERISREVSSIIPSSEARPTCVGTQDRFYFVCSIADATASSTEVGYWLDEITLELIRTHQSPPDYDFDTFDEEESLTEDVSSLEFLYHDGEAWIETWDSREGGEQAGRLPRAVKVSFTVEDLRGAGSEDFSTVITLATSYE